jgi:mono/diheme cytochrome c family protein
MTDQLPERPNDSIPFWPAAVVIGSVALLLLLLSGVLTGDRAPEEPPPAVALEPTGTPTLDATFTPTPTFTPIAEREVVALDPASIARGERSFQGTCVACHGFDARGIPGLGPSMIANDYINQLSDEDLTALIIVGREVTHPENTTGVAMPARGGNPSLSDDDIDDLVNYIRSLNVEAVAAAPPAEEPTATLTPDGPTATPTEFTLPSLEGLELPEREERAAAEGPDPFFTSGETAYNRSCAGCHGLDGRGVELVDSDLHDSELLADRSGISLLEYLTDARPPGDPGVEFPHPYRGGYPVLTDEQILNIIGYLYELTD